MICSCKHLRNWCPRASVMEIITRVAYVFWYIIHWIAPRALLNMDALGIYNMECDTFKPLATSEEHLFQTGRRWNLAAQPGASIGRRELSI